MQLVVGESIRKHYKESFFQLSNETFGLQFEEWDKLGYWDHTYRPFSFVDGNKVIANVSTSYATMVLDGQYYKAAQIGTVMTHPQYRGQGLSKQLMLKVMEQLVHIDIVYLFANHTVLDFYPKFGFEKRTQATFSVQTSALKGKALEVKKLNMHDSKSRELLYHMVVHRFPVSLRMSMLQNENIVMFHALTQYRNCIYYVPSFDAIVIAEEDEQQFLLIDVISKSSIDLWALLNALPIKAPMLCFGFTPDTLPIQVEQGVVSDTGAMFVKEQRIVNYPNDVLYPYSGLA